MAWIRVIEEGSADEKLRTAYSHVRSARGKVANIMRIHSLHPETMLTHLDLYRSLMFGRSPLDRRTRELLATVVSAINQCDYCVAHHSAALDFYVKDAGLVMQIAHDFRGIRLSKRENAILDYAEKLTLRPFMMQSMDLGRLREAGLSDREILDVNLIVSYFNFANRLALGLGVEFGSEEVSGYKY